MYKNGFEYVEAYKMTLPFIPFAQSMYPVWFDRKINWDGNIHFKVSERNFAFFGSKVSEESTF